MPPVTPSRAATASMRGYHYQILWTALRWCELPDYAILVVEGQEDIDVELPDTYAQIVEQVKLREARNLTAAEIYECVGFFADEYMRGRDTGQDVMSVLRTSSRRPAVRKAALLAWLDAKPVDEAGLLVELKKALPTRHPLLERMVAEKCFAAFLASVRWAWSAGDLSDVEAKLRHELQKLAPRLDPARAVDAVVAALLSRARTRRAELRRVERADLDACLNDLALGPQPTTAPAEDAVLALTLARSSARVAAVILWIPSLTGALRRVATHQELQRSMGDSQWQSAVGPLAEQDFIALASTAGLGGEAEAACLRDVVRHARYRWTQMDLHAGAYKGANFPADWREVRPPHPVVVALALRAASAVLGHVHGEGERDAGVLHRLRWIHLLPERRYLTAETGFEAKALNVAPSPTE